MKGCKTIRIALLQCSLTRHFPNVIIFVVVLLKQKR